MVAVATFPAPPAFTVGSACDGSITRASPLSRNACSQYRSRSCRRLILLLFRLCRRRRRRCGRGRRPSRAARLDHLLGRIFSAFFFMYALKSAGCGSIGPSLGAPSGIPLSHPPRTDAKINPAATFPNRFIKRRPSQWNGRHFRPSGTTLNVFISRSSGPDCKHDPPS